MSPFFAFAGLFVATQDFQPGATITLDQAIEYAERNAFAIQIQKTRVEKEHQEALSKEAQMGPALNLGATYTRFDQPTTAAFGGSTFTIVPLQQPIATAGISLPIDITGNMHRIVRATKANQYAQRETLAADEADIRRNVRSAYLAILRARSQVAVAEEALRSDTARATNVDQRYKAGILAQVDVLRAQTQQAQSESNLIAAKNGLALAKQNLNNVLARPIEDEFEVADVPAADVDVSDPRALTGVAEKNRHEAKALELTVQALADVRRVAEHANQPFLNVSLGVTETAKPLGFGQRPQVEAGTLALNWPILDSGSYRAEVRAARQDEAQAKLQLQQVQLEISLEVRQAATNLSNARARAVVADRQAETARVTLKEAQLRQEQGVGILLEVIDAQRDLTNAEFAQVSAKYDVLQAIADLQRAVGSDRLN